MNSSFDKPNKSEFIDTNKKRSRDKTRDEYLQPSSPLSYKNPVISGKILREKYPHLLGTITQFIDELQIVEKFSKRVQPFCDLVNFTAANTHIYKGIYYFKICKKMYLRADIAHPDIIVSKSNDYGFNRDERYFYINTRIALLLVHKVLTKDEIEKIFITRLTLRFVLFCSFDFDLSNARLVKFFLYIKS